MSKSVEDLFKEHAAQCECNLCKEALAHNVPLKKCPYCKWSAMTQAVEEGDPQACMFNAVMDMCEAGWTQVERPVNKPEGMYFRMSPPMEYYYVQMFIFGAIEDKMFAIAIGIDGNSVGKTLDDLKDLNESIPAMADDIKNGVDNPPTDLIEIVEMIEEAKR